MTLDNFRTVNLTIDKANGHFFSDQFAKEGDYDGRRLVVQITDNGVVEDLSHVDVHLGWKHDDKKNSGLNSFEAVDAGKGIFEVYYPREMLHPGQVTAVIQIVDDGKITETKNFRIKVGDSVVNAQAAVEENSFTILQEALIKVNQYDNRINSLERDKADKAELEQTKQEVTAQLAQTESELKLKADDYKVRKKSVSIGLSDLDGETLGVLQNGTGGTPVNVLSIPREGSVTPETTSFIGRTENVFKGEYIEGKALNYEVPTSTVTNLFNFNGGIVAIAEIEPDTNYRIVKKESSDRFRVALFNEYPDLNSDLVPVDVSVFVGNDSLTRHEFFSTSSSKYVVIQVSSSGEKPELEVFENYYLDSQIKFEVAPEDTSFIRPADNLFKGEYLDDKALNYQVQGNWIHSFFDFDGGVVAIAEIEPNKNYKVEKLSTSNRFRIALLDEYPDLSNPDVVPDTSIFVGNDNFMSYEFTSDVNSQYVLVQVSSIGQKPQLTITDADVVYELDEKIQVKNIDSKILSDLDWLKKMNEEQNSHLYKEKYYWLDTINDIYRASDTVTTIDDSSHQTIYAFYDSLVSEFPEYVSMKIIGRDALDNEIREYTFSMPDIGDQGTFVIGLAGELNKTLNRLKFTITGGVHGNEKAPIRAAARFFEELCKNPDDKEVIDVLRTNVDFVIVPIVNPSGVTSNQRQNHNGVDLNRNISELESAQSESKVIVSWFNTHQDAFYHFDWHDHNYEGGDLPMAFVSNDESANMVYSLFRTLTRKWSNEYNYNPQNKTTGYLSNEINGDTLTRYAESLGVRSLLLEVGRYTFKYASSNTDFERTNIEIFVNFIITVLKNR